MAWKYTYKGELKKLTAYLEDIIADRQTCKPSFIRLRQTGVEMLIIEVKARKTLPSHERLMATTIQKEVMRSIWAELQPMYYYLACIYAVSASQSQSQLNEIETALLEAHENSRVFNYQFLLEKTRKKYKVFVHNPYRNVCFAYSDLISSVLSFLEIPAFSDLLLF